jgi:hypothetical protein
LVSRWLYTKSTPSSTSTSCCRQIYCSASAITGELRAEAAVGHGLDRSSFGGALILSVAAAIRLLRLVDPHGEAAAIERWRTVARTFEGEASEVRALLAGAVANGRLDQAELVELGLESPSPVTAEGARMLVLRRHAQPDVAGNLSIDGLAACSRLQHASPPPTWSSDVPRAVQTAAAIGDGNTGVTRLLRPPAPHVERLVGIHQSFATWVSAAESSSTVGNYCGQLAGDAIEMCGDGPTIMICHDDTAQAVTVGILGRGAAPLGRSLDYLEGISIALTQPPKAVRLGSPP